MPWNWEGLTKNPSVTCEDIMAHPEKPWDWFMLSCKPSLPIDIVLAHPGKPWNWNYLSSNQSITFDDVVTNPDMPWSWKALSANPRMLVTKAEEARIAKTRLLVTRIQRRWRACVSDPSHPVCRRRLMRELKDMI